MNSTKADMLAKPVHGDAEWTIGQLPTNNFDDTANPHQTVPWHDLVASHTVAPTQSNEWTQGLAAISQFYDANDNGMYQVRGTDYPPHQEQSFSDQLFDQRQILTILQDFLPRHQTSLTKQGLNLINCLLKIFLVSICSLQDKGMILRLRDRALLLDHPGK
uniref:Uncharacterized protein n=1 Tax=Melanopsichium pennsylvanicum 4 TaxID=1398559 RepID=A0A077R2T7_9BASI|nr:uncharacterized protein BN887_05672 [Melanopsichium pennsylvanicum 4]